MRRRLIALLVAALAAAGLAVLPATSPAAQAGTPSDYPEYPYAATDYTEAFRGQFHFSPQSGFMNDINAPLYYRGVYHLFFQHNPHGLGWDTIHWGHATSPDLVHWTQQPIALEPGVHAGNLWSGAGWVDVDNVTGLKKGNDDPILLFTNTEGVSIAYSTDGARTFQMYNGGAKVITDSTESRDPKVQWDAANNRWVMVTFRAGTGAVFYTSTNLLDWTYRGTYAASWFVECPDLYRLPVDGGETEKWVLQDASGEYVIGSLNASGVFVSDWASPQRMEWGKSDAAFAPSVWYASQTFNQLPAGRVVQMGWQPSNAGVTWTGNASFPVELGLKTFPEGIRLTRNPVSEIAGIRSSTQTWGSRSITTSSSSDPLTGISADTYELTAVFSLDGATASEFGFRLHARADGTSDRTVAYATATQSLYGMALPPISNQVTIRLLVDRGQLEVFGNDGKMVFSDNVEFDSSAGSRGIKLYATGGSVTLTSLSFSPIESTWAPAPAGLAPSAAIASTAHQDMCVDRDVATGNAQLWSCLGNANQTWALDSYGQLTTGGVCLQLPSGQTANLTLVSVAACTGGTNQKWRQGNFGSLINLASGRCLDVPEADFSNGRQLQVYDCVGTRNQSWVGPPYSAAAGRIAWNTSTSCADRDAATDTVQIWSCNGLANQTWRLNADGTLTSGGACMQLSPGSLGNGALVGSAACSPTAANQRWSRFANGQLRNVAAGRCLDLDSGNTTNGRQLIVWDCVGGPNQTWAGPA
ncbi:ricin-type beta-trefoil lectin domain protein [Aeromicrobium ginsengisoli]|uniref:Glycoside hydrolase family 32 protein n=1 Tax=Aeromicrobium ginsengisoli TaxID=363867 RepID=A0A5M4FFV5_9ACTN|nr:ricin-type beta-trefoil lectin domain protein [Aeromicrobium ginsengisoli]KAA1397741.1 glycoside hydrolase family 32 protein [Aeromicrobium ginsengisoli]